MRVTARSRRLDDRKGVTYGKPAKVVKDMVEDEAVQEKPAADEGRIQDKEEGLNVRQARAGRGDRMTIEQGIAKIIKKHVKLSRIEHSVVWDIIQYLDSEGVVRKVDSGFPPIQGRFTERENARRLVKEGWSKTERLVSADDR